MEELRSLCAESSCCLGRSGRVCASTGRGLARSVRVCAGTLVDSVCARSDVIEDIQPNAVDEDGVTPFMWASREGCQDIVRMPLEQDNIKANAPGGDGWTALMYASHFGHEEIVRMLFKQEDITLNASDKWGDTAYDNALENGRNGIAKMILKRSGKAQDEALRILQMVFVYRSQPTRETGRNSISIFIQLEMGLVIKGILAWMVHILLLDTLYNCCTTVRKSIPATSESSRALFTPGWELA
jgi:Ankyrin repeats (3 copies)